MYKNYNLWDRLRVCIVGRTWPPEFYDWIKDTNIRDILRNIAKETEEDYDRLSSCLENLGVTVLRPDLPDVMPEKMLPPPMSPRDHMCMIGDTFVETFNWCYPSIGDVLPKDVPPSMPFYTRIFDHIRDQGNTVKTVEIANASGAMLYQFNNDIYYSRWPHQDNVQVREQLSAYTHDRHLKPFYQFGHIDGWFCPVTPGLIIASRDEHRQDLLDLFFRKYFPDYEVVYKDPSLQFDNSFVQWQKRHAGTWWIPGQEHNQNLTHFIDTYLHQWLGEIAETVFEVNMLPVDSQNVIVGRYNQHIFDKLAAYGVTPHICTLRHKTFWDIGISCATADIHRQT